ncbi:MFS transporter [Streptomyces sp. NPDC001594]|uniref:MFS transporter n=1 Tax=Streptomyces sp. NPDC001594 TaxID=3364590 RepID=UPI0036AE8133
MDVTPLRQRDFRLVMASGVITMFGNFTTYVAIPYQIKELTGSYVAVGLVGVIELVPMILCGLYGGALADSMDRRRIILTTEIGMTVLGLALLGNALLENPVVWLLYVVAGAMAALDGLQRPALNALTPRLVPRDQIPAANALQGLRWQIGAIAGPAIGGLLVTQVGLGAAYGLDVASFIVSALLLSRLRPTAVPEGAEPPSLKSIADGARYAFSRQELVGTYLVDIAAMFLAMPTSLFPFVADALDAPWALGLMYTATSVGALLVTLTSGWVKHVHRHGLAVLLAAAVWGLAITGFGAVSNIGLAVTFLVVAGAADMVSGLFRQTIWNQTIPDSYRGRLAGIELLSFSIGPTLGQTRAGGMAAVYGLRGAIVSGGLMCVGAAALLGAVLPRFTRYDERTSPHNDASPEPQAEADASVPQQG